MLCVLCVLLCNLFYRMWRGGPPRKPRPPPPGPLSNPQWAHLQLIRSQMILQPPQPPGPPPARPPAPPSTSLPLPPGSNVPRLPHLRMDIRNLGNQRPILPPPQSLSTLPHPRGPVQYRAQRPVRDFPQSTLSHPSGIVPQRMQNSVHVPQTASYLQPSESDVSHHEPPVDDRDLSPRSFTPPIHSNFPPRSYSPPDDRNLPLRSEHQDSPLRSYSSPEHGGIPPHRDLPPRSYFPRDHRNFSTKLHQSHDHDHPLRSRSLMSSSHDPSSEGYADYEEFSSPRSYTPPHGNYPPEPYEVPHNRDFSPERSYRHRSPGDYPQRSFTPPGYRESPTSSYRTYYHEDLHPEECYEPDHPDVYSRSFSPSNPRDVPLESYTQQDYRHLPPRRPHTPPDRWHPPSEESRPPFESRDIPSLLSVQQPISREQVST